MSLYIECVTSTLIPNVNYGFWIMRYNVDSLILTNVKYLFKHIDSGRGYMCVVVDGIWEISTRSLNVALNLKLHYKYYVDLRDSCIIWKIYRNENFINRKYLLLKLNSRLTWVSIQQQKIMLFKFSVQKFNIIVFDSVYQL